MKEFQQTRRKQKYSQTNRICWYIECPLMNISISTTFRLCFHLGSKLLDLWWGKQAVVGDWRMMPGDIFSEHYSPLTPTIILQKSRVVGVILFGMVVLLASLCVHWRPVTLQVMVYIPLETTAPVQEVHCSDHWVKCSSFGHFLAISLPIWHCCRALPEHGRWTLIHFSIWCI